MDAKSYNGDVDDREFGPDYAEERCLLCGASEDEDCTPECGCAHCLRTRPQTKPDRDAA
jgi:hypothetical protein